MAEGVRKKGSRLHRVCDSGQKPGAALPVCLPREPSVVGTFCFLMVEAVCVCLSVCVCVCVCVSFTPISSLVPASFLLPPNAVPIPGQTHRGTSKELNLKAPLFQSPRSGTDIKSPPPI